MDRRRSLAAVVVSAACFGTLAVFTTYAYRGGAEPLPLLAWRFAFVALLLLAVQAVRSPRALAITRGDAARFAVLSLSGYGAASICFFYALRFADASVVAVLLYTYPAIVSVAGVVLFREPFSAARAGAVVLTFAGCALVVGAFQPGSHASLTGVLLGLGAALGYAVFNLGSHRWMGRTSRPVLMTYTFGFSAVGVSLLALAAGQSLSPADWTPTAWAMLAAIVLVPTFLAVMLYLEGVSGLGASQAAVVSTFEPLFTIVLAAAFLGERLAAWQWLGALLVLAGVALAEWGAGGGVRPEHVAQV